MSRRVSEFVGVAFFAAALIWFIALATYNPADPVWFFNAGSDATPANFIGRVGAFLAEFSNQLFGHAAYLIPVLIFAIGWHYFWCRVLQALVTKAVGATLLFGSACAILSLAFPDAPSIPGDVQAGGYLGYWLAGILAASLNRTGSIILILTVSFLAIILSTQLSFGRLSSAGLRLVMDRTLRLRDGLRARRDERRREKQRQEVLRKHLENCDPADAPGARAAIKAHVADREKPLRASVVTPPAKAKARKAVTPTIARATPPVEPETQSVGRAAKTPALRRSGAYALPPLALLDATRSAPKIDERELMNGAQLLEEKAREFSVEGSVVQIHPGPVVTTYEFKPDAGIKYSKITGLADDLCLTMRADSVLIDRIAGKSTVGIQIPNHVREQISLRELLEAEEYQNAPSKLTLALGKTIHGEPFFTDLATMPHLLIAGSTGTGKSVSVNAMLSSLLFRATPDDVRLIMIDPKRLELGMYEHIPHLMTPVVVDPKLASNALRWAVREMEERYKTLAGFGVRNIDQFNRNVRQMLQEGGDATGADAPPKTLPYIVIVIDELADLMMVVGRDIEESIARLAQMARAVGIHLILATQRPSVDVLTGLIKANLPARISFRVSSKTDSRTILDGNGAEQLLGKGDMLYLPPASARFIRIHGPYISEQESARLASFLRKQGQPDYDESITAEEKGDEQTIEFEKDDLYDQAARIVVSQSQASISYLQRRLRIGFSRAARLIDMMEADGLVSTGGGGKARELLVPTDYFEQVDLQLR